MAKQEDIAEVDKELEDILENEVQCYDSDGGVARGTSPGRPPSANSSVGSNGSSASGSKGKRRSWKKPKDKPKRPLSAYNLFFKHERSRIVEGKMEDATAEEVIRSIEGILSTSRETRRHRKTHGRISFGDLARKIAEKWKGIGSEQKAVFEHYAELDMRRYRKEVKLWKDKKEAEGLAGKTGSGMHENMNNSMSSLDSESEFSLDNLTSHSSNDAWAPRRSFYDSLSSSFSSIASETSLEPIPIGSMLQNASNNLNGRIPGFVAASDFPSMQAQTTGQPVDMPHPLGQLSMEAPMMSQNNIGGNAAAQFPDSMSSANSALQQTQDSLIQLQRQQQLLLRQQQILQQQMQQGSGHNNNSAMVAANLMQMNRSGGYQQGSHPFGLQSAQGIGDSPVPLDSNPAFTFEGEDLGNYLSNLDLSNV